MIDIFLLKAHIMGFFVKYYFTFKMSIATQLKHSYSRQVLTIENIYQKLKSEKVEKLVESNEDGYVSLLAVFCDNSKLKIIDINGNLYYIEI